MPDWLGNVPPDRFPFLKAVVEGFDQILDTQIQRPSANVEKRPDPLESAMGVSTYWSKSSFENFEYQYPDADEVMPARKRFKASPGH